MCMAFGKAHYCEGCTVARTVKIAAIMIILYHDTMMIILMGILNNHIYLTCRLIESRTDEGTQPGSEDDERDDDSSVSSA